jgi:DNA invertase Pin-like site-specific DNA recombinase
MRCVGYARVSSDEQAKSGAGMAAQHSAIVAEATRRGWELLEVVEDRGFSARDLKRPGLRGALHRLAARDADALVVSKLA